MDNARVPLTPDLEQRFRELVRVFLAENQKVNLSAFRTEENCWTGNILDSLAFLDVFKTFPISHSSRRRPKPKSDFPFAILEVGIGGGFPLLPLAIALPEHRFTGIDATQKKIDAVARICNALTMPNVTLLCGRAEDLGRDPSHREQYDIVLARALAELPVLLEYASPFVKPKGFTVAWKSMNITNELQSSLLARAELSCHLTRTHPYDLGGTFGKRQLLLFEKLSPLSAKYPRAVGVPKKHPLS